MSMSTTNAGFYEMKLVAGDFFEALLGPQRSIEQVSKLMTEKFRFETNLVNEVAMETLDREKILAEFDEKHMKNIIGDVRKRKETYRESTKTSNKLVCKVKSVQTRRGYGDNEAGAGIFRLSGRICFHMKREDDGQLRIRKIVQTNYKKESISEAE